MTDLPTGWEWATLEDLLGAGLFVDGDWVESKDQDPDGAVRLLQLADVGDGVFRDRSDRHLTAATARRLGCTYLESGDILVARMPEPLGRACRVPPLSGPAVTVVDVCVLRPTAGGVNPTWLMWAVNSPHFRRKVSELQSGSTRKRISRKNLASIHLPVPPREEQARIVAAIEEHLSRLDASARAIATARARLEQMAQKVKEAILTNGAPQASLADLTIESRYGTSVKCDYASSGPGVLRIPHIADERVSVDDLKFATDASGVSKDVLLSEGDVLFVRTNGSKDLIGRAAVVAGEAIGLAFASYLIRYRTKPGVDPRYLCAAVSAPSIRRELESLAATTAGQYNLSVSKLDSVVVPLPPMPVQQRLLDERSVRLAGIKRMAEVLLGAEQRSKALRRAILVAACTGRLAPQNPDDEPAADLLKRIRTERADAAPTKRKRKVKAS